MSCLVGYYPTPNSRGKLDSLVCAIRCCLLEVVVYNYLLEELVVTDAGDTLELNSKTGSLKVDFELDPQVQYCILQFLCSQRPPKYSYCCCGKFYWREPKILMTFHQQLVWRSYFLDCCLSLAVIFLDCCLIWQSFSWTVVLVWRSFSWTILNLVTFALSKLLEKDIL